MARDHYRGSVTCTYNDAPQFALIFANGKLLDLLVHDSTFMFFDATFHTCPRPFYQLLNIMVSYKGVVIPVFHCYMTCKAAPLYEKLFIRIRALFEVKPVIANTDFESALTKALRDVFEGVIVHGCTFHFDQAVFKTIMSPSKIEIKSHNILLTMGQFLTVGQLRNQLPTVHTDFILACHFISFCFISLQNTASQVTTPTTSK